MKLEVRQVMVEFFLMTVYDIQQNLRRSKIRCSEVKEKHQVFHASFLKSEDKM